ncbi:hypothetical protein DFH27DRAFT_529862 [Peziza echinospora]|nr:hypothetical protein DFH27DRAFT_529862 [Peziza echinospora]
MSPTTQSQKPQGQVSKLLSKSEKVKRRKKLLDTITQSKQGNAFANQLTTVFDKVDSQPLTLEETEALWADVHAILQDKKLEMELDGVFDHEDLDMPDVPEEAEGAGNTKAAEGTMAAKGTTVA